MSVSTPPAIQRQSPVMKLRGAQGTSKPWSTHTVPVTVRTHPNAALIATNPTRRALPSLPMSERLENWMDGYVLAWTTNETADITALFAADAVYDPQTGAGEWEGLDQIIQGWQEVDDEEGNWEFEWLPVVEADDLAVVTGRTRYLEPPASYRNLFVIRFDPEDRCYDFTEWWIEEEGP